ncbi:hypothetical protein ACFE04_014220 [Oxalis oulophora]
MSESIDWEELYEAIAYDSQSLPPNKAGLKPVRRRRSRAPNKTPTTLLNASAGNFRALVQQFTGCRKRQRGPINLNFALANNDHGRVMAPTFSTIVGSDYNHRQLVEPPLESIYQEQSFVSIDDNPFNFGAPTNTMGVEKLVRWP